MTWLLLLLHGVTHISEFRHRYDDVPDFDAMVRDYFRPQ